MFITKMSLSRRTFLRGAGVTVALPFLEAMVPAMTATAAKTAANPTKRFGAIYIPHGAIMDQWTPPTAGTGFDFTPILKPLEPFKESHDHGEQHWRGRAARSTNTHVATAAGWLSGAIAKPTEGEDIYLGTTADQVHRQEIGQDTPFPSIELAVENFSGFIGACGTNYSCAYANTLAWSTPTTPLPTEINPRVDVPAAVRPARHQRTACGAHARGPQHPRRDPAGRQRTAARPGRARQRPARGLSRQHPRDRAPHPADRGARTARTVSLDAPLGVPESFEEHVGLLFDIVAVAYQADLTRVFTLMMGREGGNKTYPALGITEGHHQLSHHGGKPEQIAKHARLNHFHVEQFAKFIAKLKAGARRRRQRARPLADRLRQRHEQRQRALARPAAGRDARRRCGPGHTATSRPRRRRPIGNLWVSVAEKFGSRTETIGDQQRPSRSVAHGVSMRRGTSSVLGLVRGRVRGPLGRRWCLVARSWAWRLRAPADAAHRRGEGGRRPGRAGRCEAGGGGERRRGRRHDGAPLGRARRRPGHGAAAAAGRAPSRTPPTATA